MCIHERYVFITPKTRDAMENLGSLDTATVWGLILTLETFLPSLVFSLLSVNTWQAESSKIDSYCGEKPPSWRTDPVFSTLLLLVLNHVRLIKKSMPIKASK